MGFTLAALNKFLRRKMIINAFTLLFFISGATHQSDLSAEDTAKGNEQPRLKIGLVLGGGGARGAAHVGVLKVIEENRIPIDYIVGTSMGAIVGGLYASGMSVSELEDVFKSIDWKDLFTDRPSRKDLSFRHKQAKKQLIDFEMGFNKGKFVLPKGIVAGQKLGFLLKTITLKVSDIKDFNELPIPFHAIATDIETGEMVALEKGNLAEAMRASMSVPGVFSPVEINGKMLVDGGIVKNLPIDIARQMGADIIIAVDVGVPLAKREKLESLIDITMQVVGIMTLQNVKEELGKLKEKDLLISPDLGDFTTSDFIKAPEIIKLGEDEGRKFADNLKRYSVKDEEYRVFLAKQRKEGIKPIKVDYVNIEKPKRVDSRRIEKRVRTKPSAALNLETLKGDLSRVYEIGDFEKVDFKLGKEEEKQSLSIDTKEKSWGPNYVRFGLNISDDFRGDAYYNFLTEYTMTEVNTLGAEWKNELQLGRTRRFLSEFYQPLDYSDLFFIIPKFKYERSVSDVFSGNSRIAEYSVNTLEGGFDMGVNLGTHAQTKFGIVRSTIDAKTLVGEDLPEFDINQGALTSSFTYDQIDDSNFPKYGIASDIRLFKAEKGLGADESYEKLEFGLIKATTFNKHTFLMSLDSGMRLGKELPFYDELTLGGFLSLSGYRKGQLRGQYSGLGRVMYYYKVTELPAKWIDGLYIGGSLESGNVWDKSKYVKLDDLLYGGTIFVGADTIFGPLYLGYGATEGGEEGEIYLFLGQTF
jgi:NTE family protein